MGRSVVVLQLCLEDDVLVYHIIHSPSIPGELHDFLSREDVYLCGATIEGDKQKLEPYNLDLKSIADLQTRIKIPVEDCDKQTPLRESWIRGYPDSRTICFGPTVGL